MHYKTFGKGLPIVLLHGFCLDGRIWNKLENKLSKYYKLIIPDLPGFGKSELSSKEITIEKIAENLLQVFKKEKISNCIMIGHSMGGYVALAFAEKYPKYLVGLGLFHSHPFQDSLEKKVERNKVIKFIKSYGHKRFISEFMPKLFAKSGINKNKATIDKLKARAYQYNSGAIIAAIKAMKNRPDRTKILKSLNIPVMFILGREDVTFPFIKAISQTYLPDISIIHTLEKVGHMGMLEKPDEISKIILEYAEKIDS